MDNEALMIIRKALDGWERPCEECEYSIRGRCCKWECVPEQRIIKAALEQAEKKPA